MGTELTAALTDPVRLAAVRASGLLDTPPEEQFDRLGRLAAALLRAPVALVTLLDVDRQFFKPCLGLPGPWAGWRQSPLSPSICQHVLSSGEPLLIEDARRHPDLQGNLA